MSTPYINAVHRTFKIIADILNSKPTDWNPSGLVGDSADQFVTVFNRVYGEAQVEQHCLPVTAHKASTALGIRIYFRMDTGPMVPVAELSTQVIEDWASRT